MTYVLGHDSHGHQITSQTGCSGSITIPVDGEHDDAANIFAVFDAEYTDNAGAHHAHAAHPAAAQAPGRALPARSPASWITARTDAEGGQTVGDINNGDWIAFEPYRLDNVTGRSPPGSPRRRPAARSRSGPARATGTVLGSVTVPVTGDLGHLHQRHRRT